MKPYDKRAVCPKCGHKHVKATYHDPEKAHYISKCKVSKEHIDRVCQNCFFQWEERCLSRRMRA